MKSIRKITPIQDTALRLKILNRSAQAANAASHFITPDRANIKFSLAPVFIQSVFKRVQCWRAHNIIREVVPFIRNAVYKEEFSDIQAVGPSLEEFELMTPGP